MQNTKRIRDQIRKIAVQLSENMLLLKGSVSLVKHKRTNKKGKTVFYEGYILTYKGVGNKTKTVYVSENKIELVKERISNWREACQLLDELCNLNVQLLKSEKR